MADNVRYSPAKPAGGKSKRTTLEKGLIVGLVIAIILIIILIIVLAVKAKQLSDYKKDHKVIRNPLYAQAAARTLGSMNVSVDPCDDFYQYACGGYVEEHKDLPPDIAGLDLISSLTLDLQDDLQELLSEPIARSDIESVRKVKRAYRACMDNETVERRTGQPMLDLLEEYDTWPVLNPSWNNDMTSIQHLLEELALEVPSTLVGLTVMYDLRNASYSTLFVSQPEIPFMEQMLDSSHVSVDITEAYQELGVNLAKLLAPGNADHTRIEREMREMFEFERQLARICVSKKVASDLDHIYNPMELSELQRRYPQIWDWNNFLTAVMHEAGIDFSPSSRVLVTTLEYFRDLNQILETTDKKTIVNYMLWQVVFNKFQLLSKEYMDLMAPLRLLTEGTTTGRPRETLCVNLMNEVFAPVLGRIYGRAHFSQEAKEDTLDMIKELKAAFRTLAEESDWMDHETRRKALEKLDAMGEAVGYPDYIMNDEELNEEFEDIVINNGRHFENVRDAMRAAILKNLATYNQRIDMSRWRGIKPAEVGAYHVKTENRLVITAGILQKHFYHNEYPKFMDYGGIGHVIGHEVTHGYDSQGRQFNKNGDLAEWWTPETAAKYDERAECMVDQYNEYKFDDVDQHVNGELTLAENIADNGGVKEAYKAYKSWLKKHGKEPSLPGFDHMSNEKMFFLSWAQIWCMAIRPSMKTSLLQTDVHAPNQFRVIGVTQNSKEFAEAYDCPKGSPMNPEKKCVVW